MQVETVDIASLKTDPENANVHSSESIDAIKAALKEFGQQKPIVVNRDNVVIAGNGVFRAAMRLCWRTIDVVRTDLVGPKLKAFAISDNRVAEFSTLDSKVVSAAIEDIRRESERLLGMRDILPEHEIEALSKQTSEDVSRMIAAIGYSDSELKKLESAGNVFPPKDPKDPKEPKSDPKGWVVIISCSSEDSQKQTFESLQSAGYSVRMATT